MYVVSYALAKIIQVLSPPGLARIQNLYHVLHACQTNSADVMHANVLSVECVIITCIKHGWLC